MSENENIENNDQQDDQQPCCESSSCSDSGNCASKMKYAAFGLIMLLAVGVAAHALIEKNKGVSASTCGTNACTTCPSQLGGLGSCGDSDNCALAPKPKETAAGCPSQKADAGTCAMGSASGCSSKSAGCPSEKKCCGSETCKEKDKADEAK
ncbi:MAG TPA: hypothetical protein ENH94_02285 [Phycisphaerales bacterium]|nr:hypothetical protein [Phycisphaerales bacterium]